MRRSRRTFLPAAGIATAVLTLLAVAGPASAAGDEPERGEAYMGIGIRAHEGGDARPSPAANLAGVEGVDVSGHQGDVDWATLSSSGVQWAYVKATEATSYTNPYFTQQYNGSHDAGMIRGAYHFAVPDSSGGADQANYFVDNGGGWSKDGKTLPGALDMEYNPYGDTCYGLSASAMVDWIKDFNATYKSRTGRDPVIYTSASWWNQCTGGSTEFGSVNPLWVPRYADAPGELPAGWSVHTFWQYTDSGPTVGDHNRFNGEHDRLVALANG